jgi:AcrR family transcriptional regulator
MMMVERGGTRLKIMALAQDFLRAHGYNGFSYTHIAQALGVKNAAIHYHFPGKEDLGVALLNRERRRFKKLAAGSTIQAMGAQEKLDWFFSIYAEYSNQGQQVCYLGAFEVGYGDLPQSIKREIRLLHDEMLAWLADVLEQGRSDGAFEFRGEAQDKALLLMGAVQGAVQIARMGSPDQLFAAIRQAKQDLGLGA